MDHLVLEKHRLGEVLLMHLAENFTEFHLEVLEMKQRSEDTEELMSVRCQV